MPISGDHTALSTDEPGCGGGWPRGRGTPNGPFREQSRSVSLRRMVGNSDNATPVAKLRTVPESRAGGSGAAANRRFFTASIPVAAAMPAQTGIGRTSRWRAEPPHLGGEAVTEKYEGKRECRCVTARLGSLETAKILSGLSGNLQRAVH